LTATPPNSAASPIVGIDLGTTNSLVAIAGWPVASHAGAAAQSPRVLTDAAGTMLVPSTVRFDLDDPSAAPIVGVLAVAGAAAHAGTTISSAKRLMGRSFADAAPDLAYLPYHVVAGPGNTARIALRTANGESGRSISPQEVAAHVLHALRMRASEALGCAVTRAVITVPAYFDEAQRQATRDAARLAGLDAVRVVAEPTAAALAYGLGAHNAAAGAGAGATGTAGSERAVVVYDFGGGTFDVSVLRIVAGGSDDSSNAIADAFQVLATDGDTHLGGDDIDHALCELLLAPSGLSMAALTDQARRMVRDAAEQAKIRLSASEQTEVRVEIAAGGEVRTIVRTITRGEFEELVAPLLARTLTSCKRAMADAQRDLAGLAISAVVLVGGSTRIPLVRREVEAHFGIVPYTALDPDLVVALGAAVQGAIMMRQEAGLGRSAVLLDVVPLSLGLETTGGAMAKLVLRGSTVPCRASEMFSTSVDGQTSITLTVLQGEREMAADCRTLGTFYLRGIPPMPAGIPQLRVEFAIDTGGILSVTALEQRSGKRLAVQIVPNHGLTQQEVERIEQESFTHARSDMQRHRVADLLANSKLDLHWIGRQHTKHADKLDAASRAGLDLAIAELKRFVELATTASRGEHTSMLDANAMQRAKEELDRASMRLHEIAIAESIKGMKPGA